MTEKNMFNRLIIIILIVLLIIGNIILIFNNQVIGKSKAWIIQPTGLYNLREDYEEGIAALSLNELIRQGEFDCILVLGAKVYSDGRLSKVLEDRCKLGISLYKIGASNALLLSGDHGQKRYDEVGSMLEYAKTQGVPLDDIFLDHAGFSTYESLVRAKKIFGAQKILIVTQRFHLYRAIFIAQSLGMQAYGLNSDLRNYGRSANLSFEMREILARNKDWFFSKILKPHPKYLGDPIDLSGSGQITQEDAY